MADHYRVVNVRRHIKETRDVRCSAAGGATAFLLITNNNNAIC